MGMAGEENRGRQAGKARKMGEAARETEEGTHKMTGWGKFSMTIFGERIERKPPAAPEGRRGRFWVVPGRQTGRRIPLAAAARWNSAAGPGGAQSRRESGTKGFFGPTAL